jgi:hypothetical protein
MNQERMGWELMVRHGMILVLSGLILAVAYGDE